MSAPTPTLEALLSTYDHYFMYQNTSSTYIPTTDYDIMDGLNECRTARVAEILSDFRTLQYYITSAPTEPENADDYYAEGWTTLRQCVLDGHHILECASDTRVPVAEGGEMEQMKAELKQRHEGQKIYLRQGAAKRWVEFREMILQGQRPHPAAQAQLQACDRQLRAELSSITDEAVYHGLAASDNSSGRWTVEDPSLRSVLRWLRARQP
ncbi:hypothetical protein E4U55_001375 [Claviceps digitariae]|nr:hypothetical protein E4U55_001375 [Claviceps digitariae]